MAAAASSASSTDATSRSLLQLPPEGALRPLLEALLEGRWGLPQGGGQLLCLACP